MLPAFVLVITAAFYLWSIQRTIFEGGDEGQPPESLHGETPPDISGHENVALFLLALLIVLFGVMPFIALDMMNSWSNTLVEMVFAQPGGA